MNLLKNKAFYTISSICLLMVLTFFDFFPTNLDKDKKGVAPHPASVISVKAVKQEKKLFKNSFKASGEISAWQEIIVSSELEGLMIEEVYVEVGDKVKKGQLLASYNSRAIEIELNGSKAKVEELKITHDEARLNLERAQKLHNENSISEQELQGGEVYELRSAAQLKSARAQVNKFELMLEQVKVLAPDDGTILSKFIEVGHVTKLTQELFRIQRQSRIEWLAKVDVNHLNMIRQEQFAVIFLNDDQTLQGKVRMIAPEVNRHSQYGLVYVDLPSHELLLPGMFFSGQFDVGEYEALALPSSSIQFKHGFSYVKVIGEDGSITERKIIVGKYFKHYYEIISGLLIEEDVVKSGVEFLGTGDYVTVVNSDNQELNNNMLGSYLL